MISTQYINLNMIPSGVMPVLYCSQYDIRRPLGVVVYNGSESVDLSSYTCTIEATRTDKTPVTAAVTTSGNIGVFETTATMTNQADTYKGKLVLTDGNGKRVASLAFVLVVTVRTMDEDAEEIEEDASLYQQYTGTVQTIIASIRADLAAEASTRAAAVSAEAAARQSADNTLQSNLNAEASTRASADALLQSEIDEIIAPSGEAPSAAEVENARIGADGVTYPTLGDAIRTQNSLLKSQIRLNYDGLESFLTHGIFAIGGLNTDGTLKPTQTTRVSSASPASKMTFDRDITVNVKSGYTWGYISFTGDTPGSWSGWKSSATIIPANTAFVVQIRKEPEGTATANVGEYVLALTFSSFTTDRLVDLENNVDSVYKHGFVSLHYKLEDGGINTGSGADYNEAGTYAASHKRTKGYIIPENGYTFVFVAPRGISVNVFRYTSDNTYIGNLGFQQKHLYTATNNEKIRFSFSSIDGTTAISIDDIYKYGVATINNFVLSNLFDIVSAPCYVIPSSLSGSKVFSEISEVSRACQGSCTDGTYLYVAYIDDSTTTELLKISMSDWTVSARVSGNWGHMNDLYYNPTADEIWSIYNTSSAYNTMIKFDASDLSVVSTVDLSTVVNSINASANFTGITYLPDYDRYIFAVTVGSTLIGFAYLKPDFTLEKYVKVNQSSRTTQNIDLYDGMIVETDYNPGNRINFYDFCGNKIGYIAVSDGTELESFSNTDGKLYCVYNTSSYKELAIYEYTITALTKIEKANVLSQYNPN